MDTSSITANWQEYIYHAPWAAITSMDLSKVLGVHLQTINNWHIRGILPPPVTHRSLRGNKNYYRISTIRSWLEGKTEDQIVWEWAHTHLRDQLNTLHTLRQLESLVNCGYDLFGLKKPNIPSAFSV